MDRRPAVPVAVVDLTDRAAVDLLTGERRVDYEQIYTEYDVGRMRAGYVCAACGEAQDEAFPAVCKYDWCGFPIREKQAQRFAQDFGGFAAPIGPSKSIAQLRAEDDEQKERARRQREGKPTSRILIPRAL